MRRRRADHIDFRRIVARRLDLDRACDPRDVDGRVLRELEAVMDPLTLGQQIKEVLSSMGLHLGMQIPGWPPENIEDLAKRLEEPY